MKFIKKAAALFFCAALALSVMAVGALADEDEAELLAGSDGQVETKTNGDFTVMMVRSPAVDEDGTDNDVNLDILDRDNVLGYEINANQKVSFDIYMAYNHSTSNADLGSFTIDGFQFDFKPANNYGAKISNAVIYHGENATTSEPGVWDNDGVWSGTTTPITHPSGANTPSYFLNNSADYVNTYTFSALGTGANDLAQPDDNALTFSYDRTKSNATSEEVTGGTKIGTITLDFTGATQAVNIYPQIENLLIHVRKTEDLQQPDAAEKQQGTTTYNSANWDTQTEGSGVISGGKAPTGGAITTQPSQPANGACVIVAPIPVIVNPVYTVTLEKFAPNAKSGIISKVTEGENKTDTLKYDFTSGSFTTGASNNYADAATGGNPTVLTNGTHNVNTAPTMLGYTLQGWMVTKNDETSDTWAAYTGKKSATENFAPKWDMSTSYPATTQLMEVPNSGNSALEYLNHWYLGDSGDTSALDEWYKVTSGGRVEFSVKPENGAYYTNSAGKYLNKQAGVNFIPVNKLQSQDNYQQVIGSTAFPAGLVGDITLTPVYTRDVYTATFLSGDDDAAFGAAANALGQTGIAPYTSAGVAKSQDDNTVVNHKYTRNYTIEDLWDVSKESDQTENNEIVDFLYLLDANKTVTTAENGPAYWKGPQGLERKAYKFMGWKLTDNEDTNGDVPVAADNYKWVRVDDPKTTAVETEATQTERVAVATYNSDLVLKNPTAKHYGDVTFEAVWEEDIYYSEIGYQYAGSGNNLILVVVPKDNYDANYTYTYKVNNVAKRMFIVNPKSETNNGTTIEVGQRKTYVDAALALASGEFAISGNDATTYDTEHYDEKITEAKVMGQKGYVLFAYIAAAETSPADNNVVRSNIANVEIVEAEGDYAEVIQAPEGNALKIGVTNTKCRNYELLYDGDVDGSRKIDAGDFGNVDSLFVDPSANTAKIFQVTDYTNGNNTIDGWYGVRSRLEADMYYKDGTDAKFGSISDVMAIYNLMGYKKTPTT